MIDFHKVIRCTSLLILLCITYATSHPTSAHAQADTVHSRMGLYYLQDSTTIKYELGWYRLNQGGALRFLGFADTTLVNPKTDYFRSDVFAATGQDSISFDRIAWFDDSTYVRPYSFDASLQDSSDLYTYLEATDSVERTKEISPSTSSFSATSFMDFIVQVVKASTNTVVSSFDTLHCFRNGDGYMRFQNFPRSVNIRSELPLNLTADTLYYLRVHRNQSLPGSSVIARYGFSETDENMGAMFYMATPHQVGYSNETRVSLADVNKTQFEDSTALLALFKRAATSIELTTSTPEPGVAAINIVDTRGRVVMDRSLHLQSGQHIYTLDNVSLPSGIYFLQLIQLGKVHTTKLIISK